MARLKLNAGSDAVAENNNDRKEFVSDRLTMFHGDVKTTFLAKEKKVSGFILPAFSPVLSPEDEAFATSFGPYRDNTQFEQDEKGNQTMDHKFSRWVFSAGAYRFFGNSRSDFFAPDTVPSDREGEFRPNPIVDLRRYIYGRRKGGDETYMSLVTKTDDKKAFLPQPSMVCFMNAWCNGIGKNDDPSVRENRVLLMSQTAMKKVYEELNTTARRGVTPLDPDWDEYTLGDITHPMHAVKFNAIMHAGSTKTYDYPGITFGNASTGQGVEVGQLTKEMLSGRYDLEDDTVFRVCSYDEIVLLLLREGAPYELVRDVCADKCDNPFPEEGSYSLYESRNQDSAGTAHPSAPKPQYEHQKATSALASKAQNLRDEPEEEDDIPMGDSKPAPAVSTAPKPLPPAQASAGSGPLTADEVERLQVLRKQMLTNSDAMTDDEVNEYMALNKRRKDFGMA